MRKIFRFLRERRKVVLLSALIYVIVFHFIYTHYWSHNARLTYAAAITEADSRRLSSTGAASPGEQGTFLDAKKDAATGFFMSLWKFRLPDAFSNLIETKHQHGADDSESVFDIHLEDSVLGHTGEVAGSTDHHHARNGNDTGVIIAIGGGITSRGVAGVDASSDFVAKFQFFNTFLQTFCETACANFTYRCYLAYDHVDPVFGNEQIAAGFQRTFAHETKKMCLEPRGVRTSLHLVQCSHAGKPAWAQNDAMLEAYIDHVDYFYRINDDTRYKLLLSVCLIFLRNCLL